MPDATGRPRVVLAMAYEREPTGPAFQSYVQTQANPFAEIVPFLVGSTVIHLARQEMINYAKSDPSLDYLIMVDSDQVWGPRIVERLVRWDLPVVAPVIVQRNGPALPVAYRFVAQDETGNYRYAPLIYEVGAYMSMFDPKWFDGPSCILPELPDHPPRMADLPPELREGLSSPLMRVDAVGCGMVCFSCEMLRQIEPDPKTQLYMDWTGGGEDFSLMRRLTAAGFPIHVDRGAYVGHLTTYSRGPDDLFMELERQEVERREEESKEAALPSVPELVERLKAGA